ncbi:hypothetical protein E4K72_00180 [Oxalobacteraceae bacterium OM1]|nr:hypothetical protein E4K72_00180 [Oxalobacteraceae bacterium OM1]
MDDDYQFAHLNWAARRRIHPREGTPQREIRWGAGDILREAARVEGHCAHVPASKPPTVLFGLAPVEVEALAHAWAKTVRQKNGAVLRQDSPVLACGVLSLPRKRMHDWRRFRRDAVELLHAMYGTRLRSVVEHLDEAHPHLHFFVVPHPGEGFGVVHPGYAARTRTGSKGEWPTYNAAMRAWQDLVHDKLGARYGLARTGPQRKRLTRAQWKLEQLVLAADAAEARRRAAVEDATRILREAEDEANRLRADAARKLQAVDAERAWLARLLAQLVDEAVLEPGVLPALQECERRLARVATDEEWNATTPVLPPDARMGRLDTLQAVLNAMGVTGEPRGMDLSGTPAARPAPRMR